jgi:tetratricopeptide (TPR) repeat protein
MGPYRITAPLGEGGMGVVYRAEHQETGQAVAVKTARVQYGGEIAGLRCEIHALSRVRHPGIVRIVDEGLEAGLPWYAMELLEGRTLLDYHRSLWTTAAYGDSDLLTVKRVAPAPAVDSTEATVPVTSALQALRPPPAIVDATGPTPPFPQMSSESPTLPRGRANGGPESFVAPPGSVPAVLHGRKPAAGGRLLEALDVIRRLCAPLACLHAAGIVHRDLKPANVFIRPDGSPVLVDFGLVSRSAAAVGRDVIEVAGHVIGTVAYMAPEQIRGELVDARCDLYALGCILYETVTGRVPFVAGSAAAILPLHLGRAPAPPSDLVDGVPPELDALILRLLEKPARRRFGHADDVAAILAEICGLSPEASPEATSAGYLYRPEIAGRKEVLQQVTEQIGEATCGGGSFLLVGGESGVGKTCFAAAVARTATLNGLRVVTGECTPVATSDATVSDVRGAPLHPFRRLFDTLGDRCRERGREATDHIFGARGKVLAAYQPHLATLPGQDAYPEPPEVPAQAARHRLLAALADSLAAFVEEEPTLLILDDLQWADELSLDFLATLDASYFRSRRLLVLGTYRSEEVTDALREIIGSPAVKRIDLGRLDEETVGAIVGDMLAMDRPPEAFVKVLARRSSGNPFFVAEYLRTAVAEGLLYRQRGAWRVDAEQATEESYEALPLPGSLRELVGRRLHGLGADVGALVDVAAVLGREFDGDLLVAVAGVERDAALVAIKELLARQVIEETVPGRFRFVHDKLREIAYERVAEGRRASLHREAAHTIERRHAGTSGFSLLYSELAHHFAEGGELQRAIAYLEKAAEQSQRDFANRETARFLTDALALDDRAPVKVDVLRRASWERQIGNAYLGLGRLPESRAHLHNAVALLGYAVPEPRPRLALGLLREVATQVVHRLRMPRHERHTQGERAVILEAARGYDLLVPVTYYVTGDLLPILFVTVANLNLAERAGPSPELALAYVSSHLTVGLIPWSSLAATYGKKAHEALVGVTDPSVRTWVYVLAGAYATGVGQWDVAFDLGNKALVIAKEVGFKRRIEEAQGVLGTAHNLHGDFEQARDISQRTYESGLRGDPQTQVWGLAGVAQACTQLAQTERALVTAKEAEKCLVHKLGRPEKIITYGVLALAYLRAGEEDLARRTAELGAACQAEGNPISFYCIHAYSCIAEVFLDLFERARNTASKDREKLQKQALRACKEVDGSARIFSVHRPRALLLRGRYEALAGNLEGARRLWEKAILAAKALDLAYEEGLAELALALHMSRSDPARRARLLRAKGLLERKNAAHDLVRVAEALG